MKAPHYPIVFVRGYAATMSEIEDAVSTPYMGFNLGSTKIRQAHDGKAVRFIFESPLIRLMKEYGYCETYNQGDLIDKGFVDRKREEGEDLFKSIWIFRYYERVSEELGTGSRVRIPEFAKDLQAFILQIRDLLCDTAAEKRKFKLYLVSHSMGGLVCRCYLQNICANKPSYVDKVFTYATPHNGIDVFGLNVPDLGAFDRIHASNFERGEMKKYLKITRAGKAANTLDGKFDPQRFFCFIGTNYRDYGAFFGASRKVTGPMSDGLVMMKNAYVEDAPRAFAHRSHSGHYGIVNSEEGYQNLTRFLFGQVRVTVSLETNDITLPQSVYKLLLDKTGAPDWRRLKASYYVETTATIRNEKYFVNERQVHQESAIRKEYDDLKKKRTMLFTGFLNGPSQTETIDGRISFAVRVSIQVPVYEVDKRFWFDGHFEGSYILWETLILSFDPKNKKNTVRYRTNRQTEEKPVAVEKKAAGAKGPDVYRIPLGFDATLPAEEKPPESFSGDLVLEVSPWNDWH